MFFTYNIGEVWFKWVFKYRSSFFLHAFYFISVSATKKTLIFGETFLKLKILSCEITKTWLGKWGNEVDKLMSQINLSRFNQFLSDVIVFLNQRC